MENEDLIEQYRTLMVVLDHVHGDLGDLGDLLRYSWWHVIFFSEFTRDIYWDCNGDLLGYDLGYDLGYGGRYNQLSNLGLKMAQKLPFHREMMKKKNQWLQGQSQQ